MAAAESTIERVVTSDTSRAVQIQVLVYSAHCCGVLQSGAVFCYSGSRSCSAINTVVVWKVMFGESESIAVVHTCVSG